MQLSLATGVLYVRRREKQEHSAKSFDRRRQQHGYAQNQGKVLGPWAAELDQSWRGLWTSTHQKALRLDIRGVTFVDRNGTQILRDIVGTTGAEVLADSPLTQYFAKQAKSETALEPTEET